MTTEHVNNSIEHQGIVQEVTPKSIKVNLLNVSGCASCHTRSTCSVSDVDAKVIEVVNEGQEISKGDAVVVGFQKSLAPLALFLGYALPFILLLLVLFISWEATGEELISGIVSLSTVLIYYTVLSLFRKKLKSTFTFTLQKG